jgi:trimethylamine--corrinoid protein Co-methyltransferase
MNPVVGGKYHPLKEGEIKKILDASFTILSEIGVEVYSQLAFEAFQRRGAVCDASKKLVKLPKSMVEDAIDKAPKKIVLRGREEKHDIQCEGTNVHFGTAGTVLQIIDLETDEVRQTILQDVRDVVRLLDALENIHFIVIPPYPNELSQDEVDINRFHSAIMNSSKHIAGSVFTLKGTLDIIKMAEMIAGSSQNLRERPFISFLTALVSPLRIDELYGNMLYRIAEAGIPVHLSSEPTAGVTAPVTLAGLLAGLHAEALSGLTLAQIINPGTPVIYAISGSVPDFSTMGFLGGAVENGLINAAGSAIAQYLNLPNYTLGGMSDSKVIDVQNGYEKAISNLLIGLSGSNFIHAAAGLTEFATMISYKQYVIDNEILGMIMRAIRGIEVTDETIALNVYREVGPGGNFLSEPHTVKWMRKEHFIPKLSDRQLRENWEKSGKPTVEKNAIAMAKQILKEHRPVCLSNDLNNQLKAKFPEIRS